jgi:hypothetical protein
MSLSLHAAQAASMPSPMILSDRLLSLAQEAERAGCIITAEQLLALAHTVFDDNEPLRQ